MALLGLKSILSCFRQIQKSMAWISLCKILTFACHFILSKIYIVSLLAQFDQNWGNVEMEKYVIIVYLTFKYSSRNMRNTDTLHSTLIKIWEMLKLKNILSLFIWLSRPIKSVEMAWADPMVSAYIFSSLCLLILEFKISKDF